MSEHGRQQAEPEPEKASGSQGAGQRVRALRPVVQSGHADVPGAGSWAETGDFTGVRSRSADLPVDATALPPSVADVVGRRGSPLPADRCRDAEQRFGHDFSQVRVHTDEAAGQAAQDLGARAFTVGHHIAFGRGLYSPHSTLGARLLDHELAHVAQQQLGAEGHPAGEGVEKEASALAAEGELRKSVRQGVPVGIHLDRIESTEELNPGSGAWMASRGLSIVESMRKSHAEPGEVRQRKIREYLMYARTRPELKRLYDEAAAAFPDIAKSIAEGKPAAPQWANKWLDSKPAPGMAPAPQPGADAEAKERAESDRVRKTIEADLERSKRMPGFISWFFPGHTLPYYRDPSREMQMPLFRQQAETATGATRGLATVTQQMAAASLGAMSALLATAIVAPLAVEGAAFLGSGGVVSAAGGELSLAAGTVRAAVQGAWVFYLQNAITVNAVGLFGTEVLLSVEGDVPALLKACVEHPEQAVAIFAQAWILHVSLRVGPSGQRQDVRVAARPLPPAQQTDKRRFKLQVTSPPVVKGPDPSKKPRPLPAPTKVPDPGPASAPAPQGQPAPTTKAQPAAPPPGMSPKEMSEPDTRAHSFPGSFEPLAKQPGVDLVSGGTCTYKQGADPKTGLPTVEEKASGGVWVQIKKLDPFEDLAHLTKKIKSNVSLGMEKFDSVLKTRTSSSNWRTMSDGTKNKTTLENPDGLVLHVEVPGFAKLSAEDQNSIRRVAIDTAAAYNDFEYGSYEGLPLSVDVVDIPPSAGAAASPR